MEGYSHREFWRLEDAYPYFRDSVLTNYVLPFNNFPVPIETGQVFVIRYTRLDNSYQYGFYRSSGLIWNDLESTQEFVVSEMPSWVVVADYAELQVLYAMQVLGLDFDFTSEVNFFNGGLSLPLNAHGEIDRAIFTNPEYGWGGTEVGEFFIGVWWGDGDPAHGTVTLNLGIGEERSLTVVLQVDASAVIQLMYGMASADR